MSEIRELIRLFDETSVAELSIDTEDMKFHLKKAVLTQSAAPAPIFIPQTAVPTSASVMQQDVSLAPQTEAQPVSQAPAAAAEDPTLHTIKSPMVGTFYRSPTPEASAYVELGSKVQDKSVVCIIEAMKLMNEIEAEVNGEVVEILAQNGQLVEYGQPLFKIKRS